MVDTQTAPAPPQATITIPAPTITAGWATPQGQTPATPKEPANRTRKGRGIPAAPALAGAGNATAMALTGVYAAGGGVAVAATGGAVVLGAATAVVRRRRAVTARRASVRAGRQSGGSWPGLGGGSGPGSRGSVPVSRGAGSGGSAGRGSGLGSLGGAKTGAGSPAGSTDRLRRLLDRKSGGNGKSVASRLAEAGGAAGRGAAKAGRASGRLAREGWSKSRPARAKTWRGVKAAARKGRGLAADALKALRSGLWGSLRHFSPRKGAAKALAAWKKHRANRTAKPVAPAQPPVASTVQRPASTASPTRGATVSGGHHFVAPAMEGARAAAAYQPTGMLQVGQDFAGLQQALELHAEAMKVTVENAHGKYPLAPQIVDMMRQIHQLQLKAAEMAGELPVAFRKLHDVDLARLEQPRTGEEMWDVRANRY